MAKRKNRYGQSIFEKNPKLDLIVTLTGGVSLLLSVILFLFLPITKLNAYGITTIGEYNGLQATFGVENVLGISYFNIVILLLLIVGAVLALIKVKDKRFSLLGGFVGTIVSLMIPFAGRMTTISEQINVIGVEKAMVFGPYIVLTFSLIGALCLLAVSINANFDKYM